MKEELSGQVSAAPAALAGFDPLRLSAIEARIEELEIDRETTEVAMADIRHQLDQHHDDKEWRSRAKAALRYRGIGQRLTYKELIA